MSNKNQSAGAIYGHMGVDTPNSNKIFKKLYQNTPLNRKLKRVGKPYGFVYSPKKTPSPNKSVTRKQKITAEKKIKVLRKDFNKCTVKYEKGKKMSAKKLKQLYKDCRRYSPKLVKGKVVKRSTLIGTKKSPKSGAFTKYSREIRRKILQANKIIIDYQQQQKKESDDEVKLDKVVSLTEILETRRKKAEERGEVIVINSRSRSRSPRRKSPKRKSPKRKSPKRKKSPTRKRS